MSKACSTKNNTLVIAGLRDILVSTIYPQACRVCSLPVSSYDNGNACRSCWSETRFFNGNEALCIKCGAFFSSEPSPAPAYCHQCGEHYYDRAFALGIYEKALTAIIIQLKSSPYLPATLKRRLKERAENLKLDERADLIIPIPLAKHRQIERGFNQADLIAAELGSITGISKDSFSLMRKVHTPIHRVGMDRRARELTVMNAFAVARPRFVSGKRVLLVDDVFTSGATSSYCAKVLKKSGASSVEVFTLARAVMK